MATVGAGDDGTRARVDDALEEGVTLTHDVVSRVFVKERGEQGLPEEALRGGAYGGRPQSAPEEKETESLKPITTLSWTVIGSATSPGAMIIWR